MTAIARASGAALLLLAISSPTHAADEAYDPATRTAIQDVITHQLDAFAHDDAVKAETFASTAIQKKFPQPDKFFAMVKSNYGALLHPKRTHFDEIEVSPHGPLQKVTIIAADGTVWSAIYSFEKTDDGWRISGCGLQKMEGQQDI